MRSMLEMRSIKWGACWRWACNHSACPPSSAEILLVTMCLVVIYQCVSAKNRCHTELQCLTMGLHLFCYQAIDYYTELYKHFSCYVSMTPFFFFFFFKQNSHSLVPNLSHLFESYDRFHCNNISISFSKEFSAMELGYWNISFELQHTEAFDNSLKSGINVIWERKKIAPFYFTIHIHLVLIEVSFNRSVKVSLTVTIVPGDYSLLTRQQTITWTNDDENLWQNLWYIYMP